MAFQEIQFPANIAFSSSGGPEFFTSVVSTYGGFEQRNVNWAAARARYNVLHSIKSAEQIAELLAFFRRMRGKAYAFRFKDWADYSAVSEEIGVGDGVETNFQLLKNYDGQARKIQKPVSGSVAIFVDGVEQSSDVAVDSKTGIVSFDTAPQIGEVITADFEFDVPVRFDSDYLPVSFDAAGLNSIRDIPLVEVRV